VKVEVGVAAGLAGVEVGGLVVVISAAVVVKSCPLATEVQPMLKPKNKHTRRCGKYFIWS
jgi:hypothetical protein